MAGSPQNFDVPMEGIYQGAIAPALQDAARKTFKPWHKPRKHFVRLNQWSKETRKLLELVRPGDGGELRYLGLPGEDLLDIRVLKTLCVKRNLKLRYLGFDSSLDSPELNLSRHEVNSDEFIHPSSVVIPDELGALEAKDSVAYQYVQRHAPFDVINLDLCNSVTSMEREVIPNLEAIRTLCNIQIERRRQPWLLFLTTQVFRDTLDVSIKRRLFDRVLKNISHSATFYSSLVSTLGIQENSILSELGPKGELDRQKWFRAYVLAIAKWLLHYMMGHDYKLAVRMRRSYVYNVRGGSRDMASLAFFIEPVATLREDETGLTRPRAQPDPAPTEMDLARDLIESVAEIENLDDKLNSNKELELSMFKKSAALLAGLRYDMRAYQKFALGN